MGEGDMQDISEGGVSIKSHHPFLIETDVELAIPFEGRFINAVGRVARVQRSGKSHNVGIYFTEIDDTLHATIKEATQDYEVKLDLNYPFKRLSLIEVPIQFYTYPRSWTVAREFIQPEQIWLPENGSYVPSADFRLLNSFMDRRIDRSNQTLTKTETETSLLKQFIYNTLIGVIAEKRKPQGRPGG